MSNSPSTSLDKFVVRMPDGLRDSIGAKARANGRSMNAEVVARLEESLRSGEFTDTGKRIDVELLRKVHGQVETQDVHLEELTGQVKNLTNQLANATDRLQDIQGLLIKLVARVE